MANKHLETFTDANFEREVHAGALRVGLPTMLVFRAGHVVARVIGAVPRKTLDGVLVRLL